MRSATRLKIGKDPAYLEYVRGFLCLTCFRTQWLEALELGDVSLMKREYSCYYGMDRGTEAAHYGPRGLSQKAPDRGALPLCAMCHREGPNAAHKLGKQWEGYHGIDARTVIAALNKHYDEAGQVTMTP